MAAPSIVRISISILLNDEINASNSDKATVVTTLTALIRCYLTRECFDNISLISEIIKVIIICVFRVKFTIGIYCYQRSSLRLR